MPVRLMLAVAVAVFILVHPGLGDQASLEREYQVFAK